jgi:hypothetical protein
MKRQQHVAISSSSTLARGGCLSRSISPSTRPRISSDGVCFRFSARALNSPSSASLTFVPTDFVRSGGFREHRRNWILGRRPHDTSVSLEGQQGAGGGLRD